MIIHGIYMYICMLISISVMISCHYSSVAISADSRWSIALMTCNALFLSFPDNGRFSKAFSTNKCMLQHSEGCTISQCSTMWSLWPVLSISYWYQQLWPFLRRLDTAPHGKYLLLSHFTSNFNFWKQLLSPTHKMYGWFPCPFTAFCMSAPSYA